MIRKDPQVALLCYQMILEANDDPFRVQERFEKKLIDTVFDTTRVQLLGQNQISSAQRAYMSVQNSAFASKEEKEEAKAAMEKAATDLEERLRQEKEQDKDLLQMTPEDQGPVWAKIAFHLARYFMAIQQVGTAIELYLKIERLSNDEKLFQKAMETVYAARGKSPYFRNHKVEEQSEKQTEALDQIHSQKLSQSSSSQPSSQRESNQRESTTTDAEMKE